MKYANKIELLHNSATLMKKTIKVKDSSDI